MHGSISTGQAASSYKLPHNGLVSLAMDLATWCDTPPVCGGPNDTSGCHLAVFSEDVALACYFVAPCPPLPSHYVGVLLVLATLKNLPQMAGYSASYLFNSWCKGRV